VCSYCEPIILFDSGSYHRCSHSRKDTSAVARGHNPRLLFVLSSPTLTDGVKTLVCYISGHGFGHAVRVNEVLRALWACRPDLSVAIRSPAPRWLFELTLPAHFSHTPCTLDVGVVQHDSLSLDAEATLRAYAALVARREELIAAEVRTLATLPPGLVLTDIPALALDIAARLGVPGVALTNFSWDWIYADYLVDFPAYAHVVADLRRSYGQASLLLRLPLHGDLSAFPQIRDIPLIARKATRSRREVCERLDLPRQDRLVLLSFGGIGVTLSAVPAVPPGLTFIATQSASAGGPPPPACRFVSNVEMAAAGVRYEDLVAASDVVMTKPGYGIVSECIANATPIVYTSRGRFAEYPCLVAGIETHLPNAFISNDDLHAGRWLSALQRVLDQPRRQPHVDVSGASAAADLLLSLLA
jgi:hypothetical protein